MPPPSPIRILEKDNNRRGDLFGRLMADLFIALGYEQPRLNIHKSGRELDLSTNHRLESRRAIAECKATSDPVGGDELNKFVGAIDVEYDENRPITGYFVSLSGFRETAVEQEMHRRRTKVIILTGLQVISELVKGRILITKDRATELAGRCCAVRDHLVLDPDCELLAHERGWIWAIHYTSGKARTDFVLIHSDGTLLARAVADEVIAAERECGGIFYSLNCLNPQPLHSSDADPGVTEALSAYAKYIANECGYIQLDGLPADSDVGARRLKLENLFVPLSLDLNLEDIPRGPQRVDPGEEDYEEVMNRMPVGQVLQHHPRLALLASPGGGKSTLLKRLAVAYADPSRRDQLADNLPARAWLPLFIRCRELRGLARSSFAELLEAISQREAVRQHAQVFRAYVDRALLLGGIILLVDGLDEISDPGDRAAFVCTLRTALQAYPSIAMVVTSREAGFRHVAAHLASVCTRATLSTFNHGDVLRLCVAWHREVVGDTEKVRADAEALAATIVRNDRIKRLAVNPLLLTTLLLVKRWVGSLPTRRAVLYGKAVEVLLMTWNTEGHQPIPEEEALPQLCYVAAAMMLPRVQKISRPRLAALLKEARDALPAELGYVQDTVDQFIHRIEDRSSLLMMTGHDVEDGRLVEFFEFRHLTFQEFLTARAVVEGWHPGRNDKDTLTTVLEPHFEEEGWREIIALATVLGGKWTEGLIRQFTRIIRQTRANSAKKATMVVTLAHCLADEAAARPETIRGALHKLIGLWPQFRKAGWTQSIVEGRYGADLREEAGKALMAEKSNLANPAWALMQATWWQARQGLDSGQSVEVARKFLGFLNSSEAVLRCEGALGAQHLSFQLHKAKSENDLASCAEVLRSIAQALVPMLFTEHRAEQYTACWALVWLGVCRVWQPSTQPDVLGQLFQLWQGKDKAVRGMAAWALASQPLVKMVDRDWRESFAADQVKKVIEGYDKLKERTSKPIALIAAWYIGEPWSRAELIERIRALLERRSETDTASPTLRDILKNLGEN